MILKQMKLFELDAKEICMRKQYEYPEQISNQIKEYFIRETL